MPSYSQSRVLLSSIRSLTLYKGELTKSRRLPPIQQLKCVGKACNLFQPDVVRCYNNGGSGADIDWTCEADLPEKLRFGRIDVSCEGWDHPGDPYVLKGSCGLEYRLVNVSDNQNTGISNWLRNLSWNDLFERVFLWLVILLTIYYFFGSYILRFINSLRRNIRFGGPPSHPFRPRGGSGGGPGGGGSGRPYNHGPTYPSPPPPPYSEQPTPKPGPSSSSSASSSSGPGFWSGLGLGSLSGLAAAHLFTGGRDAGNRDRDRGYAPTTQEYDWERERLGRRGPGWFGFGTPLTTSGSVPTRPSSTPWYSWGRSTGSTYVARPSSGTGTGTGTGAEAGNNDRGEGPSNLGPMRRSTGYGVTNVR